MAAFEINIETAAKAARIAERRRNVLESRIGQFGIGMEKQQYLTRRAMRTVIHLPRPAAFGTEYLDAELPANFPASVAAAAVNDDDFMRPEG
jgi:hypothetical protein